MYFTWKIKISFRGKREVGIQNISKFGRVDFTNRFEYENQLRDTHRGTRIDKRVRATSL